MTAGPMGRVATRPMIAADASVVAQLHAESWRSAYRGIYDDRWLDEQAGANRQAHWTRRFAAPTTTEAGLVAELDGRAVGFAYLIADVEPSRGTLLDNLHVSPTVRGAGVGRRLLARAAADIAPRGWPRGLHLWVFEVNTGARRFYERHGAVIVDRTMYASADGGVNAALCYAWPDAAVLRLA